MNTAKTIIIIAIVSVLYACNSKPYPQLLRIADSLMIEYPDSALLLLKQLQNSIDDEPLPIQMYYKLLSIRGKENTQSDFKSDSLIKPLLNYYEKNKELMPEINYYAGMIYRILGDSPIAEKYLQKALNAYKGTSNYQMLYKINRNFGMIYHLNSSDTCNSINYFKEAHRYAELIEDSTLIVKSLLNVARGYQGENKDSLSHYYHKAYEIAQQMNDFGLYTNIKIEYGICMVQENDYHKAYDIFQTIHKDSIKSLPAYYHAYSQVYYDRAKWDSARYYCEQMLAVETFYYNKDAYYKDQKKGYMMMAQIAHNQGNEKEEAKNLNKSLIYSDSLLIAAIQAINKRNNWLHNYWIHEKENQHLENVIVKQKSQIILLSAGIFTIVIFIMSLFIIYSFWKRQFIKQQKQKLINIAEEQYRNSQEYITANEKHIKLLANKLKDIENQKNETTKALQEKEKELLELINKQIETKQKIQHLSEKAFTASQIYKDFYHLAGMPHSEKISNKTKLTTEDWENLKQAIDSTYNSFTERLIQFYPKISTHELRICMLLKIKIPPIAIAELTARSKQAINSSRKKLYEKTHNQPGCPDLWDKFIQKF